MHFFFPEKMMYRMAFGKVLLINLHLTQTLSGTATVSNRTTITKVFRGSVLKGPANLTAKKFRGSVEFLRFAKAIYPRGEMSDMDTPESIKDW